MNLFTRVENAFAILLTRGEYRQAELYERGGFFYAAHGRGFVRLLGNRMTTVPAVRWDAIEGVSFEERWNGVGAA